MLTSYRGLIFGSLLVLPRSCSQGDVEIAKANVHSRLQKLLVTTRVTVARVEVVVISEASGGPAEDWNSSAGVEGLGPLSINNDVGSESEPGLELVGGRKRGDCAADETKEPGIIEAQRPAKHPRIFGASVKAVHDAILSKRLFTALVFLPLPGIPEKLSGEDARVYVRSLHMYTEELPPVMLCAAVDQATMTTEL